MSDDVKDGVAPDCGKSMAFLILRGWLGIRALVTGLEKYSGTRMVDQAWKDAGGKPDASGAMVDGGLPEKFYALKNYHGVPVGLVKKFEKEPLLPQAIMGMFDTILGPLLILAGISLLIGLGTRISLFVQGIVYIMLTVGLILINQNDGVAFLGIHIGLIAMAMTLVNYNRFAIWKKS